MSALALTSFLGLESIITLLFFKEEVMWLLPFFLCAGTVNVSVQTGGILPFHLLPSSFRGGSGVS